MVRAWRVTILGLAFGGWLRQRQSAEPCCTTTPTGSAAKKPCDFIHTAARGSATRMTEKGS